MIKIVRLIKLFFFQLRKQMTLSVTLIEGADVPKSDLIGLSDPYCILSIKGKGDQQTSKYIDNTKTPVWNDNFTFFVENKNQILHIDLMDKDIPPKKDDLLASIDIPISEFPVGESLEKWYNLQCAKGVKGTPRIHLDVTLSKGKY